MRYYRESVVEKSWQLLQELKGKYKFSLIGGWAVWLYTRQLKSKDIDLVVSLESLGRLKEDWDLVKNERLRKYEFRQGEVQVDVYVPFYSDLGVKAEEIIADGRIVGGFGVCSAELLLVLESVAWLARRGSAKGRKDFLDIVSLLTGAEMEAKAIKQWRTGNAVTKEAMKRLREELELTTRVEELGLNPHQVAKFKKDWLEKI